MIGDGMIVIWLFGGASARRGEEATGIKIERGFSESLVAINED